MCTISKTSKIDLWLGGSEGWPALNNGQPFSGHLVRVHVHNCYYVTIMSLCICSVCMCSTYW